MTALTTQTAAPSTVPNATSIAADQVGTANAPAAGDRIQYVKLDIGVAGASSPITPANPLPVSAATLPLPAGAALDASVLALDADLKAEIGIVSGTPGAFTVLDRLQQIGLKIDAACKTAATEATLQKLLTALKPLPAPSSVRATLLHR